jgi:hypothetical protein
VHPADVHAVILTTKGDLNILFLHSSAALNWMEGKRLSCLTSGWSTQTCKLSGHCVTCTCFTYTIAKLFRMKNKMEKKIQVT